MYFHLYCLQCLSSICYTFTYKIFTSLVKFIPNYSSFDAVVDGIILFLFQIFFFSRVWKHSRLLGVNLYPTILLNVLINSRIFGQSIQSFLYVMSYHLQIQYHFFLTVLLIFGTSSTID